MLSEFCNLANAPRIVQLKPSHSEDLAKIFEEYAAQARDGEITGYSGMLILPGGRYKTVGWQGEDANAFQEIGMHVTMILSIWRGTLSKDDPVSSI